MVDCLSVQAEDFFTPETVLLRIFMQIKVSNLQLSMNKKRVFICLIYAFSLISVCRGANEALWMGFKYSVSVRFLAVRDAGASTLPFPKTLEMPAYPIAMMTAALSGDVILSLMIDEDGTVQSAVVDNAKPEEFGASAKFTVQRWKFRPGYLQGIAVKARMRCLVEYRAIEEGSEVNQTLSRLEKHQAEGGKP